VRLPIRTNRGMWILSLAILSNCGIVGCTEWTGCFASHQEADSSCLSVAGVHFVDLIAPSSSHQGGAVSATVTSTIQIRGSTFVCCQVFVDEADASRAGGGCWLNSGSTTSIYNSCAVMCSAYAGQFGCFSSSTVVGHEFNISSFVSCGNSASAEGARDDCLSLVDVDPRVVSLNFTGCSVEWAGCAIGARGSLGSFSSVCLTVLSCTGLSCLFAYTGPKRPTVDHSNFIRNTLTPSGNAVCAVIAANHASSMIVTDCIFQGTSPKGYEFSIGAPMEVRHTVTNCIFSGSLAFSAQVSQSGNKVTKTASHALPQNDIAVCSATACPTASHSAVRSRSAPPVRSIRASGSPVPTPSADFGPSSHFGDRISHESRELSGRFIPTASQFPPERPRPSVVFQAPSARRSLAGESSSPVSETAILRRGEAPNVPDLRRGIRRP
jgi:hypothetical protein